MKKTSIVLLLSLLVFSSCQEPPQELVTRFQSIVFGYIGGPKYAAYLESAQKTRVFASGIQSVWQNRARFYDTNGVVSSIPAAYINGIHLDSGAIGALNYAHVPYNAYHVWQVDGRGIVASFTDSVLAPAAFIITEPDHTTQHDSASVSGFTLQYTSPGTDSVAITLMYDPRYSKLRDASITDTATRTVAVYTANTGSYAFSSSQLSGFPSKGIVQITVLAWRTKSAVHGPRQYLLRATSVASNVAYLKN